MTVIVMNTAAGAVTEYDWEFQSITAQHAAGEPGLCALGGGTDAGEEIDARVIGGASGGEKMLGLGNVYLTVDGEGDGVLIVQGRTGNWEYPVAERTSGISRAKPGKGIRESRLALGYRNVAGADFRLDRLDAEINESKTRRV